MQDASKRNVLNEMLDSITKESSDRGCSYARSPSVSAVGDMVCLIMDEDAPSDAMIVSTGESRPSLSWWEVSSEDGM